MQRRYQDVELDGVTYRVHDIPARTMLPLVQQMNEDAADPAAQLQIMTEAVTVDGQPIDAGEMGTSVYMRLLNVVMEVNGMATPGEGDEGNSLSPGS